MADKKIFNAIDKILYILFTTLIILVIMLFTI